MENMTSADFIEYADRFRESKVVVIDTGYTDESRTAKIKEILTTLISEMGITDALPPIALITADGVTISKYDTTLPILSIYSGDFVEIGADAFVDASRIEAGDSGSVAAYPGSGFLRRNARGLYFKEALAQKYELNSVTARTLVDGSNYLLLATRLPVYSWTTEIYSLNGDITFTTRSLPKINTIFLPVNVSNLLYNYDNKVTDLLLREVFYCVLECYCQSKGIDYKAVNLKSEIESMCEITQEYMEKMLAQLYTTNIKQREIFLKEKTAAIAQDIQRITVAYRALLQAHEVYSMELIGIHQIQSKLPDVKKALERLIKKYRVRLLSGSTLEIHFPDIKISNVPLGDFIGKINIQTCELSLVGSQTIIGKSGNGYCHPHIQEDGTVCMGNMKPILLKHIATLNLVGIADLFNLFLHSYNPNSAYVQLSEFADVAKVSQEVIDAIPRGGVVGYETGIEAEPMNENELDEIATIDIADIAVEPIEINDQIGTIDHIEIDATAPL